MPAHAVEGPGHDLLLPANVAVIADQRQARAVGSLHQALVSGVLVQWLIDPERAPSPAGLAAALAAIAAQLTADPA